MFPRLNMRLILKHSKPTQPGTKAAEPSVCYHRFAIWFTSTHPTRSDTATWHSTKVQHRAITRWFYQEHKHEPLINQCYYNIRSRLLCIDKQELDMCSFPPISNHLRSKSAVFQHVSLFQITSIHNGESTLVPDGFTIHKLRSA